MTELSQTCKLNHRKFALPRLAFALALVALVWLVVLPKISNWPFVRQHIDCMKANEITVDAMFYTELDWCPMR